jgi:hypothetical protein
MIFSDDCKYFFPFFEVQKDFSGRHYLVFILSDTFNLGLPGLREEEEEKPTDLL